MKYLLTSICLLINCLMPLSAQDNRDVFAEGKAQYQEGAYYEAYQRFSAAYTLSKNMGDAAYQDLSRTWLQKSAAGIRAEQQRTDRLLKATRKLTDAFYFYDDRLALAYQEFYNEGRFGFINRQGEVVIGYEYTSATNFDETTGYAKVEKEEKRYWLAPDGTEYPIEKAVEDLPVVSTKENSYSSNEQQEASMTNSLEGFRVNGSKDYHQELQEGIDLYDEGDYFASFQRFNAVNVLAENDDDDRLAELGSQLRDSAVQRIQLLAVQAADALEVAQNIREAFYFYDGKYALASGEKAGQKVFYFIDKAGNEFQKLKRWQNAEQFDYKGFARVVDDDGINYLLDTMGQIYRVAFQLEELNSEIKALDLRGVKLNKFPKEVFGHKQLEILLLDGEPFNHNNFSSFPSGIRKCSKLRTLSLCYCQIQSLPTEITELKSLNTLYLGNNPLSSLPTEITQLTNLTTLDLSYNKLTSLPHPIIQLKNVTFLDLAGNDLDSLPIEITQLTNLTALSLNDNRLSSLPPQIGQLNKLIKLDLGINYLDSLPPQIGQLDKLIELVLSENELKKLPPKLGS